MRNVIPRITRPYKNESMLSLVNSLLVFKACGIKPLVNSFPTILKGAQATGTTFILNSVVKKTFFKHFCGGENLKEVVPRMQSLANSNIGSILDLAIEADLDAPEVSGTEAQLQAREVVSKFKECVDIACTQRDSFIAIKITALYPPKLLKNWTMTLNLLYSEFTKISNNHLVDLKMFVSLSKKFPGLNSLDLQALFKSNDLNNDGYLSFADLIAIFSIHGKYCHALVGDGLISKSELDTAALILDEIKVLIEYAQEKNVKLMMDAEQTYFQAAIDDIVIGLCRKYNVKFNKKKSDKISGPLIFNTYQMYLVSALQRMQQDIDRASQEGYSFGLKIVRGAYMESERQLASEKCYPSPIHPNIDETHKAYNSAIDLILKKMSTFDKDSCLPLSLVIASHNHDSTVYARKLISDYNIEKDGRVAFAQLLGMQDILTNELASESLKAYKYVPYGPVDVAIPYLYRRAQENSAMVKGMIADKNLIKNELKMRFFK
jgi:proline dehydrogenase